jgi:hypothetical protein
LIKISGTVDESHHKMGEAVRTMKNANETDKDTMVHLKKQTDIMTNTSSKLSEAESYTMRSDQVIRNMIRRVFTNKLVLLAVIILLGLIIVFIIYIKLKYKIFGS